MVWAAAAEMKSCGPRSAIRPPDQILEMRELRADQLAKIDAFPLGFHKQILARRQRANPLAEALDKVLGIVRRRLPGNRLHRPLQDVNAALSWLLLRMPTSNHSFATTLALSPLEHGKVPALGRPV